MEPQIKMPDKHLADLKSSDWADSKDDLVRLSCLLEKNVGRFSNYQVIPGFIREMIPEIGNTGYQQRQICLDASRYRWLREQYKETGFKAVEIGANLGYFSLRLADDCGAEVTAYEPLSDYAEICRILSSVGKVKEKVSVINREVDFEGLLTLPFSDLMIHLNVLHHAGSSFDLNRVSKRQHWRSHAREYLRRLSEKTSFLFFQTGNMWNGEPLFPGADAVPFTAELLENSNWRVESIGVIDDLETLEYATFMVDEIGEIPRIYCRRNPGSNLVDYYLEGEVIGNFRTGLAQRPLWFCRTQH